MNITIKKMECLPEENLPSFLEDKMCKVGLNARLTVSFTQKDLLTG